MQLNFLSQISLQFQSTRFLLVEKRNDFNSTK